MAIPYDFDEETALAAALALQQVLEQRTHRRKYLGQIYTVPGKLGEALNLPTIVSRLGSKVARRRQTGVEQFEELWATLSTTTQHKVLAAIDWYDPQQLNWDDKRSNRRPLLTTGAATDAASTGTTTTATSPAVASGEQARSAEAAGQERMTEERADQE